MSLHQHRESPIDVSPQDEEWRVLEFTAPYTGDRCFLLLFAYVCPQTKLQWMTLLAYASCSLLDVLLAGVTCSLFWSGPKFSIQYVAWFPKYDGS